MQRHPQLRSAGDIEVEIQAPSRSQRTWRSLRRYSLHLVVAVAYLVSARRLLDIPRRYAVNIFNGDQWDFNNATLFQRHSLWQAFRWQHGPPRQGLGAVLQRLLDPLIRWNTRYEALGSGAVIFIAAVLGLYLKKRLFGSIGWSDIIIPLLFLTPAEFGTLLFSANPAHGPLPLLLMVLYCLAWTVRPELCKYAFVLVVDFVMTYTGFGLFIGFITPLLLVADIFHDRRKFSVRVRVGSGVAVLGSLLSLASFFVGYKMEPAASCFSPWPRNPLQYGRFISLMLANFVGVKGTGFWPTLAGCVIGIGMLLCLSMAVKGLLSSSAQWNRSVVICALLGYCLLFCVNAAYGRLCLGLEMAQSSRYMIYLVPGFLAVYLYGLDQRKRTTRGSTVFGVLLVALLSSFHLNYGDRLLMEASGRHKRAWRDCYLARHDIEQCNELTKFKIYPFPPQVTHLQEKLDFLERTRLNLYANEARPGR
jgi:hypothetical protein